MTKYKTQVITFFNKAFVTQMCNTWTDYENGDRISLAPTILQRHEHLDHNTKGEGSVACSSSVLPGSVSYCLNVSLEYAQIGEPG
jgi:hypothetical protein